MTHSTVQVQFEESCHCTIKLDLCKKQKQSDETQAKDKEGKQKPRKTFLFYFSFFLKNLLDEVFPIGIIKDLKRTFL